MNFLCDVHISLKVKNYIISLGHYAEHVNNILDGFYTKDYKISQFCDKNDLILIIKDKDFKDSHFIKNSPKKLLRISLGNISNITLIKILERNLKIIEDTDEKFNSFMIEIKRDSLSIISN